MKEKAKTVEKRENQRFAAQSTLHRVNQQSQFII
jgi:hypothetical protein